MTALDEKGLTQYRRDHVGFVFQFYNLVPSLTARENVQLVTEIARHPMSADQALALVGLLKHRLYTYRWLRLLVWLYFTEGVVRATSEGGIVVALALAEVVLCLLLFACCVLHVRRRLRREAVQA